MEVRPGDFGKALMEVKTQVPLADYTSWMVGGKADYFVMPETEPQLLEALQFATEKRIPITVLGGGSNVLISDQGIEGLVICLRRYSKAEIKIDDDRLIIECLSGTPKTELLKTFLKHKLAPALFLAGLPGDVGGGVVMNAGVAEAMRPREFHEIVDWFEVYKLTEEGWGLVRYDYDQVRWIYRHSIGWQPGVISRVGLSWPLEEEEEILQKVRDANKVRLSKQPLDLPSCGSVFVNPPGHKAAQLIDSSGLKGYRVGGAEVSKKHANFIVNVGGATAMDIKQVIDHVRKTVFEKTRVQLATEVVWLGR